MKLRETSDTGRALAPARRRRVGLFVFAALVSSSAFAGALGLVSGTLDLGSTVNHRLPSHSPVFGGLALAVVVGVPTALVAALAWRADVRTDRATVVAGVLLIGWVVVQIAFIRELSFLQALFAGVGARLIVIGRHASHPRR